MKIATVGHSFLNANRCDIIRYDYYALHLWDTMKRRMHGEEKIQLFKRRLELQLYVLYISPFVHLWFRFFDFPGERRRAEEDVWVELWSWNCTQWRGGAPVRWKLEKRKKTVIPKDSLKWSGLHPCSRHAATTCAATRPCARFPRTEPLNQYIFYFVTSSVHFANSTRVQRG